MVKVVARNLWPWLAMAALTTAPAQAAEIYGDCRAAVWSSSRFLDDRTTVYPVTCSVDYRPAFGEHLSFGLSARGGYADAWDNTTTSTRTREAYADLSLENWQLRVGRQIIAWGRADRINPTDVLSPRDFTFLTMEDDEQRIGIDAATLKFEVTDNTALTLVVADAKGHITPAGSLPRGTTVIDSNSTDWAIKIDSSVMGVDWSATYFDGRDRYARYHAVVSGKGLPSIVGRYPRVQMLGFDAATAWGDWTGRAEASYARSKDNCPTCGNDERRIARLVVGVDCNVGNSGNINMQFFGIRRDYVSPSERPQVLHQLYEGLDRLNAEFAQTEHGLTVRWADRFYNDKFRVEVSAIFDLSRDSHLIRPRMSYDFTDSVRIFLGADRFSGRRQSFFGSRQANSVVFAGLTLQF